MSSRKINLIVEIYIDRDELLEINLKVKFVIKK